jgi:2-succinyl-6-hydroxy-2,4-cyclohexadiene-1-carboxylate synthase
MADPLVLLHGFTQTGHAWDATRERLAALAPGGEIIAPDLRGHGTNAAARPIDTEQLVADVLALTPGRFALAGYSMGGRLALHVALAAPQRIRHLILVSTTAGIRDPERSAQRRADDEALAAEIERDGTEAFADRWAQLPLWRTQSPEVRAAARAERVAQDPAGLAAALRGFGTGSMAHVWDRLKILNLPVTIVVGSEDERYREIARKLHGQMPWARVVVVAGVSHAVPLEAPGALARAMIR